MRRHESFVNQRNVSVNCQGALIKYIQGRIAIFTNLRCRTIVNTNPELISSGMHKRYKTAMILVGLAILTIGGYVYCFFGNPYPRLSLIGTDHIENSEELSVLNEQQEGTFYLIKKYKYSKHIWSIGYGGGVDRTDDFYGFGIADGHKKTILPPKFQSVQAYRDMLTQEVYIKCLPYPPYTTHDGYEYYKIENNKAVSIKGKSHY